MLGLALKLSFFRLSKGSSLLARVRGIHQSRSIFKISRVSPRFVIVSVHPKPKDTSAKRERREGN
jgi:hypothetical protein